MFDLGTTSPSVGSLRVEPMTIADIDAHPDCDRIWATLAALKSHGESEYERGQEDAEADADDAADEERDECRSALSRAVLRITDNPDKYKNAPDPLAAVLEDVAGLRFAL